MEMLSRFTKTQARKLDGKQFAGFLEDLSAWQFVDISNCADYFFEHEKEEWDIAVDFPCAMLPWPIAWLEYKQPKISTDRGKFVAEWPTDMYNGCVIGQIPIKEAHSQTVIAEDGMGQYWRSSLPVPLQETHAMKARRQDAINRALAMDRKARWMITFNLLTSIGPRIAVLGFASLYLDFLGQVIPECILLIPNSETPHEGMTSLLYPYLYALGLLHCKNVELVDAPIQRATRRRWKKEKRPDIVFKTLRVHPMRAQKRYTTEGGHSGEKKRFHICRGHFKDYRKGGGLFGRLNGIYWWEQHTRGDSEQGVIVKDYHVMGPD